MKGEEEGERATKATCKWKEPLRKKTVVKSFGFLFQVFSSLILFSLSIFYPKSHNASPSLVQSAKRCFTFYVPSPWSYAICSFFFLIRSLLAHNIYSLGIFRPSSTYIHEHA